MEKARVWELVGLRHTARAPLTKEAGWREHQEESSTDLEHGGRGGQVWGTQA